MPDPTAERDLETDGENGKQKSISGKNDKTAATLQTQPGGNAANVTSMFGTKYEDNTYEVLPEATTPDERELQGRVACLEEKALVVQTCFLEASRDEKKDYREQERLLLEAINCVQNAKEIFTDIDGTLKELEKSKETSTYATAYSAINKNRIYNPKFFKAIKKIFFPEIAATAMTILFGKKRKDDVVALFFKDANTINDAKDEWEKCYKELFDEAVAGKYVQIDGEDSLSLDSLKVMEVFVGKLKVKLGEVRNNIAEEELKAIDETDLDFKLLDDEMFKRFTQLLPFVANAFSSGDSVSTGLAFFKANAALIQKAKNAPGKNKEIAAAANIPDDENSLNPMRKMYGDVSHAREDEFYEIIAQHQKLVSEGKKAEAKALLDKYGLDKMDLNGDGSINMLEMTIYQRNWHKQWVAQQVAVGSTVKAFNATADAVGEIMDIAEKNAADKKKREKLGLEEENSHSRKFRDAVKIIDSVGKDLSALGTAGADMVLADERSKKVTEGVRSVRGLVQGIGAITSGMKAGLDVYDAHSAKVNSNTARNKICNLLEKVKTRETDKIGANLDTLGKYLNGTQRQAGSGASPQTWDLATTAEHERESMLIGFDQLKMDIRANKKGSNVMLRRIMNGLLVDCKGVLSPLSVDNIKRILLLNNIAYDADTKKMEKTHSAWSNGVNVLAKTLGAISGGFIEGKDEMDWFAASWASDFAMMTPLGKWIGLAGAVFSAVSGIIKRTGEKKAALREAEKGASGQTSAEFIRRIIYASKRPFPDNKLTGSNRENDLKGEQVLAEKSTAYKYLQLYGDMKLAGVDMMGFLYNAYTLASLQGRAKSDTQPEVEARPDYAKGVTESLDKKSLLDEQQKDAKIGIMAMLEGSKA